MVNRWIGGWGEREGSENKGEGGTRDIAVLGRTMMVQG